MRVGLRVTSCLLFLVASTCGDETPDKETDPTLVKLREVIEKSNDMFEVTSPDDPLVRMTQKPVLKWTNNERDSTSMGVVVLWIDQGRPVAAMATYSWMNNLYHEFDLLSRGSVTAKMNGSIVWTPKPGLKFGPIPDAPKVEGSSVARLRQMKMLAEQFSATMMGWRPDNSDRAELRRLPRELYRYQTKVSDTIDGAVFAFAMGTDPEVLLLIEATSKDEHSEWQYAFVRQTSGALEARHNNKIVWSVEKHAARSDPTAHGRSINSPLSLKSELGK